MGNEYLQTMKFWLEKKGEVVSTIVELLLYFYLIKANNSGLQLGEESRSLLRANFLEACCCSWSSLARQFLRLWTVKDCQYIFSEDERKKGEKTYLCTGVDNENFHTTLWNMQKYFSNRNCFEFEFNLWTSMGWRITYLCKGVKTRIFYLLFLFQLLGLCRWILKGYWLCIPLEQVC